MRVVVERGIKKGAGVEGLTYRCDLPVRLGDRVRVPLGRGNAPTGGFVVEIGGPELAGTLADEKVKRVLTVTAASLPDRLLDLARWIAGYYVCPLGVVLGTVLPAAVKRGTGVKTERLFDRSPCAPAPSLETLPKRAREIAGKIAALHETMFPATPGRLARELGLRSAASLKRLVALGVLTELTRDRIEESGYRPPDDGGADAAHDLVPAQRRVIDGIGSALDAFGMHVLRGVTGSGKTEVYLRLIERVLRRGGNAIVLVPEIALTPQTSARFLRRFRGVGVGVLHSGLSASQRHAEWDRAARGRTRIVIGARSAVFAPLANVGLIVVDEEHDPSYKQDQAPRYHGRDVAIKRAQLENCPVILGSATPSLESWANCTGPGARAKLWELPERVGGGRLPPVEVVDLAEERREMLRIDPSSRARQWAIGPRLEHALAGTLKDGGQAILLLNRRGFAHYIACQSAACGWVMNCHQCDARMVFHKEVGLPRGGDVACHHCLSRQVLPGACPDCGGRLSVFGSGTQRVEDEVARIVESCGMDPATSVVRADSDTMAGARDYFDALDRVARGEVKVLLGTQMIAKGLDFPNVRLVGVVSADTALYMPDFRSSERTFQLVSQVAGRAGRGARGGRVIVQTMEPTNPAILAAARHEYVEFANTELGTRRRSALPPVGRMARVVCRHRQAPRARSDAAFIADALRGAAGGGTRVTGPIECPINRTHGYFRYASEIIAPSAVELHRCLAAARAAGLLVSDARTAVDVDPIALL